MADPPRISGTDSNPETNTSSLRELASELVMAEVRERRRIAEDLHDHIGQYLALVRMKLSASGFSADIWANYDTDSNDLLEIDYTASYAFDLDAVNLEMGFIHYDVRGGLDSDEVYLGASFEGFLNPSLTAYYDVDAGDGAFLVAGISHPITLSDTANLDFGASVSFNVDDDYVAVKPNGESFTGLFNGELSAGASIILSDRFTLEPMLGYTFALSNTASDAIKAGSTSYDDSFVYGALSLAVTF